MKKTLIIVFFFLLSTPACKVNADSCGYIVKFNSDTFIADNRFEKLFDNTYRISGMNYFTLSCSPRSLHTILINITQQRVTIINRVKASGGSQPNPESDIFIQNRAELPTTSS